MPNYPYKCLKCGEFFEKILPVNDRNEPLKEPCPRCGEFHISRLIGLTNFVVKGYNEKNGYSKKA